MTDFQREAGKTTFPRPPSIVHLNAPMLLTIAEQEAQAQFLAAHSRYQAAKIEFAECRLTAWQLHIVRDQYFAAIAAFALACNAVPKFEFEI